MVNFARSLPTGCGKLCRRRQSFRRFPPGANRQRPPWRRYSVSLVRAFSWWRRCFLREPRLESSASLFATASCGTRGAFDRLDGDDCIGTAASGPCSLTGRVSKGMGASFFLNGFSVSDKRPRGHHAGRSYGVDCLASRKNFRRHCCQGRCMAQVPQNAPLRPLRWRSQFSPEPGCRFRGFHRIDKIDHALMNMIASRTFECSDVKARGAGGDMYQRGRCLASRTRRTLIDTHGSRLNSGGSLQNSQSPVFAEGGR